jgi:Putative adhesin
VPTGATIAARRRPSPWGFVVAGSATLLLVAAAVLGVWWLASRETQIATYSVRGTVSEVMLDLAGASAVVVGGGSAREVEVRRTDEFSFGRQARAERGVTGGVLRLRSRCPVTVLSSCSSSYRVSVPDNVPVTVHSTSGDVRFSAYRGSASIATTTGDIDVAGYCGFRLEARADSGDVRASTSCSPERLVLRSRSGDVRAIVPAGRYRVDADTDGGRRRVEGLAAADDAPFQIQALSGTGNVDVETP